jgi:hypothetical protein
VRERPGSLKVRCARALLSRLWFQLGTSCSAHRCPSTSLEFCAWRLTGKQVKELKKESKKVRTPLRPSPTTAPRKHGASTCRGKRHCQNHPTFAWRNPRRPTHTWFRYTRRTQQHVVSLSPCLLQVRQHRPLCRGVLVVGEALLQLSALPLPDHCTHADPEQASSPATSPTDARIPAPPRVRDSPLQTSMLGSQCAGRNRGLTLGQRSSATTARDSGTSRLTARLSA